MYRYVIINDLAEFMQASSVRGIVCRAISRFDVRVAKPLDRESQPGTCGGRFDEELKLCLLGI